MTPQELKQIEKELRRRFASSGGKARWKKMSPEERSKHMRKVALARVKKERHETN